MGGAGPPDTAIPTGTRVRLDRRTRMFDDGAVLLGGAPPRMMLLSPAARARLVDGTVTAADPTSAALARRLLDAGIAHPVEVPAAAVPRAGRGHRGGAGQGPGGRVGPAAGRPARGARRRVIVVDDGSADAAAHPGRGGGGGRPGAAPRHRPRPGRGPQHRAGRRDHPAGRLPRLRRGARAGLAGPAAGRVRRPGGGAGRAADRRAAADHRLARPLRGGAFVAGPGAGPGAGGAPLPGGLRAQRRAGGAPGPRWARASTSGCTWPRTSIWCCGCTRPVGGCATCRPPGSRTTTGPGSSPGGCARPTTAPGPRRWPSGTGVRCRRWCSPRPRPRSSRCC